MNWLSIAACCGLALAFTAALAQAQTRNTTAPPADTNRSGMVTLAEYQTSRTTFIMRADTNHDGQVSRAEWDSFAKAVRHDLDLSGVQGAELIGQGAWWDALDANKDGMVTRVEIDAMTTARFAQYDTNKDGFISRAEAEQA